MDRLVSPAWLAAELGQPDLVVLDATKYLPNENRDGHAEFLAAHIPGARYFDVDVIADTDSDLPHMVPTPGRFARLIGALGVGTASRVVFYDQGAPMWATRGWWMMGLFGHDDAAVLDGGFARWRREGHRVESGEPAPVPAATFRPDFRATRLRGIGDMLANLASRQELVLDARAAGRFEGRLPELRPGLRSGHIPASRNLPYGALLAEDGTFLPPAELRARLAAAGVDGSRKVVTSCGSGVSATVISMALVLAGFDPGAVYDGSWTEWGGRADTPVET